MGIFSSKYEIRASSVTTKIMEKFDNPLPGVVAGAIFTDTPLVEAISNYQNHGYYNKALNYFSYGKRKFTRGLPSGYFKDNSVPVNLLRPTIEGEIESDIEILYAYLDSESTEHVIRLYLQDERSADYTTGVLGINPSGTTGEVKYDHYDEVGLIDQIRLHYVTMGGDPAGSEIIDRLYKDERIYQVLYRELNSVSAPIGTPTYWIYVVGTGTYPQLDGESTGVPRIKDVYLPIIPFYEDKIVLSDPINSADLLYKTSKRLLSKLGLSYEDLAANLAEGTEESLGNDRGLYAYFQLSAEITAGMVKRAPGGFAPEEDEPPPTSEEIADLYNKSKDHQATMNYVFDFFLNEYANTDDEITDFKNKFKAPVGSDPRGKTTQRVEPLKKYIEITDESYRQDFSYFYIKVSHKEGTLVYGQPGYVTSEFWPEEHNMYHGGRPTTQQSIDTGVMVFKRQDSATDYTQIEVCGFKQRFTVFKNTLAITTIRDAFLEEDPKFISIPLNIKLLRKTPVRHRNMLIHASMAFVFNSYTITEIKWYATSGWKSIFAIIAIIAAVYTGGKSLVLYGTLTQIAYSIFIYLLKMYISSEIFKFVAKELGADVAYIIAMVMILTGYVKGSTTTWGSNFIDIGNAIWMSTDKYVEDLAIELQKDYAKLQSDVDKLYSELEKAQGLLDQNMVIDPWLFVNTLPSLNFSEPASAYISARLGSISLNTLILQVPSIYPAVMLRLPTIDQTLRF